MTGNCNNKDLKNTEHRPKTREQHRLNLRNFDRQNFFWKSIVLLSAHSCKTTIILGTTAPGPGGRAQLGPRAAMLWVKKACDATGSCNFPTEIWQTVANFSLERTWVLRILILPLIFYMKVFKPSCCIFGQIYLREGNFSAFFRQPKI